MRHSLADKLASRAGSTTAMIVIFVAFVVAAYDIAGHLSDDRGERFDTSAIAGIDTSSVSQDLDRLSALTAERTALDDPRMVEVLASLQMRVRQGVSTNSSALEVARVQVSVHDLEVALREVLAAALRPRVPEYDDQLAQMIEESRAEVAKMQGAIDRIVSASANKPVVANPLIISTGLLAFLAVVAGCVSLVLLRREVLARQKRTIAEQRADFLTRHDPMTGLQNAQEFEEHVLSALGGEATVLVLDLDNFAQINDRRGRSFGDAVIKEVAWRLERISDDLDGKVARLGGSRFGLLASFENHARIEELCAKVISDCGQPVAMGAQTLAPSISLGAVPLSQLRETRPTDCDAILRVASFALADSKSKSARFTIYDSGLDEHVIHDISLIEALPRAIHDEALEVHLQPRMSLVGDGVQGFEALVRWSHEGASISAVQIIALAEETGIILELDHYMLDRAVGIVADWNRRRKTKFSVSVNLSAMHFRHENGTDFVADVLAKHSYPPELLTLEIAESIRFERNPDLIRQFEKLRATGCRVSIDDFGTGFTSFATLQALGADEIKIDPSLVAELDENDEAKLIFDAVMRMAHNLHMDIIVEGVEREAQADLLRELGCQKAQGYHFGKPRPAADWLADATYGTGEAA